MREGYKRTGVKLGDPGLYSKKSKGGFCWHEGRGEVQIDGGQGDWRGMVRDVHGEYCRLMRNSHSIVKANGLAVR